MSEETKLENIMLPDLDWDPDDEDCTEEKEDPDWVEHDRPSLSFDTRACLDEMWLCGACDYKDEVALILSSPATSRQKTYAIVCGLMPYEADPDDCDSDDELELRRLHDWLFDYYGWDKEDDLRNDQVENIEHELYEKLIQSLTDRMEQQGWLQRSEITLADCISRHNSWFVGCSCLEVPNQTPYSSDFAFIHTLRWLYGRNDWEI